MTVMTTSGARVPTKSASKYLKQLCKHWAHNLDVSFDAEQGMVRFPKEMRGLTFPAEAVLTLAAHPDALQCHISACDVEQLTGLKGALERHLDRFAFREAPLSYAWEDG